MEWFAIGAGVVSGVLSGFGAAWVGRPAAQAAAEERKLQVARRQAIVDTGRAMVAQAAEEHWSPSEYREDPRFHALAPHLGNGLILDVRRGRSDADGARVNEQIAFAIDQLELGWHLS